MTVSSSVVERWATICAVVGSAAVALLRIGFRWAQVLEELQQMRENEQAIADKLVMTLPHPPTKK